MTAEAFALEMRDIAKRFPGVLALDGVSFDCHAGEVHAICGENGAGKSTLIKILGGSYGPDSGTVLIDGKPVSFGHPVEARAAGVSIIHQELSLLPDRSVAANVFLGLEIKRGMLLDRQAMAERTRALLARLNSTIDPSTRAGDLSVAEQQIVEIAKALVLDARVLVMDEPTAALDDTDAQRLLALVRQLRDEGVAIIYISHRMPEIAAIADRVTVLKDGRKVTTGPIAEMGPDQIVRFMVGRDLSDYFPPRATEAPGAPILELSGCGNDTIRDITLTVRAGEIVGVAGLEGSGKITLGRAIFGDAPFTTGTMRLSGKAVSLTSPRAAIDAGIGYVPDDRKREGLVLRQSVRDNLLLTARALGRALSPPKAGSSSDKAANALLSEFDVRAGDYGAMVGGLSGGNQQKAIVARWMARDPRLLVFAEPTRGIDVAAKAAIYRLMREHAAKGCGILMISSDLLEVVGVADRILVMHEGRIAGELPGGATEEEAMALAVGHETGNGSSAGAAA